MSALQQSIRQFRGRLTFLSIYTKVSFIICILMAICMCIALLVKIGQKEQEKQNKKTVRAAVESYEAAKPSRPVRK